MLDKKSDLIGEGMYEFVNAHCAFLFLSLFVSTYNLHHFFQNTCIHIYSCAWRHCGAQADAQEALAELYNSIGLFEPFECLFTIDIVERSLRDIISVVPIKYHSQEDINGLHPYNKYKSQQEINLDNGMIGSDNGDYDGMDSSDVDYLKILNGLRNDDSYDYNEE